VPSDQTETLSSFPGDDERWSWPLHRFRQLSARDRIVPTRARHGSSAEKRVEQLKLVLETFHAFAG